MKYKYLSIMLFLFTMGTYNAQTVGETALLSSQDLYGSARVIGVNGAFGAMGGDYSSVMINPAGIGEYKKGEFVFTPSYETITSSVNGKADVSKGKLGLDQIGLVFTTDGTDFTRNNFLIGYNKTKSFNKTYSTSESSTGSITENLVKAANGTNKDNLGFLTGLAYDAGAIYNKEGESGEIYYQDFLADEKNNKLLQNTVSGSAGEVSLAWGGNYEKTLNVGVSIGIPFFNYSETRTYVQNYESTTLENNLKLTNKNKLTGVGVNLKVGATYSPNKRLRVGLALHTPTIYQMDNEYNSTMDYSTTIKNYSNSAESELGELKYDFITPFKAIGSIGQIFKAGDVYGFVNMDLEHQNYGSVKYDLSNYTEDPQELENTKALNRELDVLKSINIARIGGELAYKHFRVRSGFSYSGASNSDKNMLGWSLGAGYSGNKTFVDVAYRASKFYNSHKKLELPISTQSNSGLFAITFGLRL